MSKPAFNTLDAIAVPLDRRNVDTDQIIPARFLRKSRSAGMADYLFHDLRADPAGVKRSDFILNHERYQSAQILVARDNFGSGSSREAAVYALWDFGFRAVIAPSFGDIFFSNSLKNGLLPIVLDPESVEALLGLLLAQPGCRVKIEPEFALFVAAGLLTVVVAVALAPAALRIVSVNVTISCVVRAGAVKLGETVLAPVTVMVPSGASLVHA